MRGASSAGSKTAKGMELASRRAAIHGASSGGGTAITREISAGGEERWVMEWESIGLVGRRHAGICWITRGVYGGGENAELG